MAWSNPAIRNVTPPHLLAEMPRSATDSTPLYDPIQESERFRLYRLCACFNCSGTGKADDGRCSECRGEGRIRELVATAATPADVGMALVTLGREGEFAECPFGLLDSLGETHHKWLVSPWLPSARNITDAARTLAQHRHTDR